MKKITLVLFFCFCAVGFSQTQNTSESGDNAATNQLRSIAAPKGVQQSKKVANDTKSNTLKAASEQFRDLSVGNAGVKANQNNRTEVKQEAIRSNGQVASSALEQQELDEYAQMIGHPSYVSNRNVVSSSNQTRGNSAIIIPTAGATESFNVVTGDLFYDTGGPGGSTTGGTPGNYPNCNCDTYTTLVGATEIDFLYYSINNTFDYLIIYDGLDVTAPVIFDSRPGDIDDLAELIAANGGSSLFSSTSGDMTFEFHASGVVDYGGWEIEITDGGAPAVFPAPYCGPIVFTNNVEPLSLVDVAGISNVTDAALNGTPAHEDFTAILGAMEEGMTYPIALEGNTDGNFTNRFAVFIDWNQNDILDDAGEVYEITETIVNSTGTDGQQATGMIAVPAGVTAGDTRMRVKKIFGTNNYLDPCLGTGFGQVEDYTITVTAGGGGGGCPIASDCNLTDTTPDDATSPNVWDRPIGAGPGISGLGPVSYDVYGPFTVDTAGDYTFESVQAGWDGYLHLYEVCFDPLDQLTGLLAGDDDGPGGVGTSQILDTPLVTGTEYYLITSGFGAGDFGDFTNSITGPGVVTCGSTPPVDNDTCLDATAVACGDVVVSDTLTNTDTGGNAAPDEWFSFTGTGAAEIVTISLCDGGTDYDSLLRVFSDCTLANEIATNDDACGLQSELSFGSDGTSTYYIMVEGFNTASGNFSLAVTCVAAPVNDNCDGALPISCGEIVAGSTDNATVDSSVAPQCDTTVTAPGVWYVYEDTTGLITDITITMCNGTTDYDSKLSVYTGDCGAPPLNCVVGNDDTCGLQSEVSFQSDGFTTFYILVHGFGGATGNFEIEMTCTPVPPPNDMIANSIDVDEIGFPYTDPSVAMPAATGEAGSPADCNNAGSRGVWYNFTPTGDGTATATISTPGGALFFTVNNGPLAGSYPAIAAAFGGEFTSTVITEDSVVILDDDTTGDPNDACDPILNGADLSGKIAIARRGACAFTDKVIAAQNAGAIAVIVVNNQPGDPIVMGGTNPDITIPALMLSDVDGEAIIAELSGASVNVSMGLAPAGFSSVTFYTAPNENAVETDLVLVDWFENQCLPGSTASIPTVAGQAYYVYVVNHSAITDIVIDGTNLGTVDNTIEGFVYYPNPAESTLNLRAQDNIERVALYNILGQKVIDQKVDATTSQLNVSELATGAYIMKVSVNGQLGTYKILKK
jgi:hypothetical protein